MELPSQGESFQRKYQLHEILGKGGFAAVYRATDLEIGRDVAIKILAPSEGEGYSSGIESRFMREARVIASLQDPHTITMFEFGRSDSGLLFMVFEYVRGTDLSLLIKRNPLPEAAVVHILKQVLHALREAHAAGVLHRDIKPANILIYEYMDDPYRAKLLDFGIAKPVAGGEGVDITSAGAMIGTPRYMAPEQIYAGELSSSSDIYSLGLVAYEMLVGRPAITGSSTKEMMVQQLSEQPVQLPPTLAINPALRNVINRMTAREPAARFSEAGHVLQAFEFVESTASGTLLPVQPDDRSWRGQYEDQSGSYVPQPNYTPPPPGPPTNTPQPNYTPQPNQAPPQNPNYQTGNQSWADRSALRDRAPSTQRELPRPKKSFASSNWALALGGLAVGAGVVSVLMLASYVMRDDAPEIAPEPPRIAKRAAPVFDTPPKPLPTVDTTSTADAGSDSAVAAAGADAGADMAVAAPSGCGMKPGWKKDKQFAIPMRFGRRSYTIYLPRSYDKDREHPVVLLFHKAFNDATWMLRDTNIRPLADRKKFVVLSFDGADKTQPWQDNDLEFVETALAETSKALCIDRSRVFAIGHGGGGDFVRNLACDFPLAGFATTGSGESAGARNCVADPPVPYIRMAGMNDNYIPVKGGPSCIGGRFKSLDDIEDDWRHDMQCGTKRTRWKKKSNGTCFTWDCAAAPFVSCHIDGGHDWPHSTPEKFEVPGCPYPPPKFPMIETIWDFFAEQPPRAR